MSVSTCATLGENLRGPWGFPETPPRPTAIVLSGTPLEEALRAPFFLIVAGLALMAAVLPPVASTDGRTFDRQPTPEERGALLAYLRKL